VLQILESARAGHLLVTAKPGCDLRARFEKPPHRGSHGSLHRLHLMTPLLASHPLAPGPARTVDILPTVLAALGIPAPAGIEGRSLWPAATPGEP
jgi:arylsulfatase A-like enzyme